MVKMQLLKSTTKRSRCCLATKYLVNFLTFDKCIVTMKASLFIGFSSKIQEILLHVILEILIVRVFHYNNVIRSFLAVVANCHGSLATLGTYDV